MKGLRKKLTRLICHALVLCMLFQAALPAAAASAKDTGPHLNKTKASVLVGKTVKLELTGDTIKSVAVKDKTVASAKKDGTVKGLKEGKTTVTVTGKSKKKYTCALTVKKGLTKTKVYLTKGTEKTVKLAGTKVRSVTSSKKSVATASIKDNTAIAIKAKKKGTAKISVIGEDGKTYTCQVTAETPSVSKKALTLAKGDEAVLKVNGTKQKISWKSSAKNRAAVDKDGKVTALAAGTVTITATDEGKKTYQCKVKVESPRIAMSELYMDVGQTADLVLSGNTQKVVWKSSDKKTATISSSGTIKAVAEGTSVMTAKVASGASYTCTVHVKAVENSSSGSSDARSTDTGDGQDVGTGDKTFPEDENPGGGQQDDPGGQEGGDPGSSTGGEDPRPSTVQVSFSVEDGSLAPLTVPYGTTVGSLPEPKYENNRKFMGYYGDSAFTQKLPDDYEITGTTVLYAKSVELDIVQTSDDAAKITAANDVGQDFSITIRSHDSGLSAQDVLDRITAANVTHAGTDAYQDKENMFSVSGSDGTYVLTGRRIFMQNEAPADGFEAGASYTFRLPDPDAEGNCELWFDGCPETVREYDVTVAAKEQNNMALKSDVVTIPVSRLDALVGPDGEPMEYIDGSFYTIDASGTQTPSEEINGYFEFSGAEAEQIALGTSVALYSGMRPEDALQNPEGFNGGDNHIAYIFVNRIEDGRYYFTNAEISDVFWTPETLPIPADADLALDEREDTYEIPVSYLDWSDDKYLDAKLDSRTKLEVGDYIALYTGAYGSESMQLQGAYRLVTDIVKGGMTVSPVGEEVEYWAITTQEATLEQIADSGETYYTRPIDILSELSSEEIREIETEIHDDAQASGFVEEAGAYLARMAMATDGFKSLSHVGDFNSYDIVVTDEDGNILQRKDGFFEEDVEEGVSEDAKNAGAGEAASALYDKYSGYKKKYKEILEGYKQFSDDKDDDDDDSKVEVKLEELSVGLKDAENLPSGTAVNLHVKFTVEVTVPKLGGDDDDDKDKDKEGEEGDKDKDKDDKDKDKDDKDKDKDDKDKDKDKENDDLKDAEEENKLNIEVTADFIQEIQLSQGFAASVEWTTVGIIPVATDVIFSPSYTTGTYTGIDINALVYTAGEDDGMGETIVDDQKEMICDITEELKNLMEEDAVEEDDEAEDINTWYSIRYKEMLSQEHDAIKIVEKTLYENKYEAVPGIVELKTELKFQVTVDLVVSLGIEFSNIQSKKTIYSIHVLKKKCEQQTIDLIPPELDFKFYVMGTLEVKAGFELELTLELMEGILGKASLTVGVGAYLDMYGFFYYHLNILDGQKKTSKAGALYVNVGIYLEVGTGQQVGKNFKKIKGKVAEFEQSWVDEKFPLKEWGDNEVTLDFNTQQEDIEDVHLRQYVTKFAVPDYFYEVSTLTLDEGDFASKILDDEYYGIDLSNSWFEYDEENHLVSLKDGYGEMEAECDMTIYFKKGYIPLSNALMKRTLHITWDNYLSGYAIAPYTQGGSYVEAIVGEKGSEVTAPKDPTKKGYVFDGWYTEDGEAYEFPETMPPQNVDIYAHWRPADDTPYTVYYFAEDPNRDGSYNCVAVKTYEGTTDSAVMPERIELEGYRTPEAEELTVLASGSAVQRYYYDIKRSRYTFVTGAHGTSADVVRTSKLGEDIYAPTISAAGYELTGWKNTGTGETLSVDRIAANNGALAQADGEDATYEAQWKVRDDILYRVEYYVQQPSGAYTVQAIDYGRGRTGDEITEEAVRSLVVTGTVLDAFGEITERTDRADGLFLEKEGDVDVVYYDGMTVNGKPVNAANPALIKADGSAVIKVRYSRRMLTIRLQGADPADQNDAYGEYQVCYGGKMALPAPVREGYTFRGFKDAKGNKVETNVETGFAIITASTDGTYTSMGWEPNKYTVKYNADGGTLAGAASEEFTYGTKKALQAAPAREGYVFKGWKDAQTGEVYGDGAEVENLTSKQNGTVKLTAQWEEEGYPVTYELNGGSIGEDANPPTYTQQMAAKALAYPARAGYTFSGWLDEDGGKVVALPGGKKGSLVLSASWTARGDVPYVVNHYRQNTDGTGTTLYEQEKLFGTAGASVTPEVKAYEGFTSPQPTEAEVKGDGTLVVDYVYTRNTHKLTIDLNGGMFEEGALDGVGADLESSSEASSDSIIFMEEEGQDRGALSEDASEGDLSDEGGSDGDEAAENAGSDGFGIEDGAAGPEDEENDDVDVSGTEDVILEGALDAAVFEETDRGGTAVYSGRVKMAALRAQSPLGEPEFGMDEINAEEDTSQEAGAAGGFPEEGFSPDDNDSEGDPAEDYSENANTADDHSGDGMADEGTDGTEWIEEGAQAPGSDIPEKGDGAQGDVPEGELPEEEQSEDASYASEGEGEGGSVELTFYYGQNVDLPMPVIPSMEGFVFAGWTVNGNPYTASTMPDEDITLAAVWEEAQAVCEVSHYLMDADGEYTILADRETLTGADGAVLDIPVREYEGFVSQDPGQVVLSAAEPVKVSVLYERGQSRIHWDLGEGQCAEEYTEGTAYYGQTIIAPSPVWEGHSYAWNETPLTVMGTDDLSYEAVWSADEVLVAFDAMGGKLDEDDAAEIRAVFGEAYGTLPVPMKPYATFLGWYDDPEGGNEVTMETPVSNGSDHVLYARWENVSAKITYKGIEATDVNENPDHFEIGKSLAIKAPVRAGYDFTGWLVDGGTELLEDYVISADRTKALVLEAQWAAKTYALTLYGYSGLYCVKKFEAGQAITSIPLPAKTGYVLEGWKNMDTEEVLDELPVAMPAQDLTLVSQWTELVYRAQFENLQGAQMDEITWKMGDNSFRVQPPTTNRTGYDFVGWYTEPGYAQESLVEELQPVPYNLTLYARWAPRTYEISLYFNEARSKDGKDSCEGMVFTYDENKAIPGTAQLGLARNGYTFGGWSVTEGGSAQFADGQVFGSGNNLSAGGETVNLFAVWNPISYTITYESVSVGASGTDNPTSYTAESSDAKLRAPAGIKEGYEFLGWFDGSGQKVTSLKLKGEWGNKTLRARWAHAGTFSIALKSSTSQTPTGSGESVFTITRAVPTGVQVSEDPQRVYFRTVNGTAVGGTVTVKSSVDGSESANNFLHVGGQNTFALFSNTECYAMIDNKKSSGTIAGNGIASVDFKVTKENVAVRYYGKETPREDNGYIALKFNLSGTKTRYYTAELYRIKSTKGDVTGVLQTREARREMTMPSDHVVSANEIYGEKTKRIALEDWFDDDSEYKNEYYLGNISDMIGKQDLYAYYRDAWVFGKLYARYECGRTKGKGWASMHIDYYLNGSKMFRNSTDSDSPGSDRAWREWTCTEVGPVPGLSTTPYSWADVRQGEIHYRGDIQEDNITYVAYTWYNWDFKITFTDVRGPRQVGIAPAATTDYKKGDKVRFSVVYDELIQRYGNVTVNTDSFKAYMPLTNVTCTGGAGTNILTFEGTAAEDFSNTTWGGTGTNNELINVKPVSNYEVYDPKGAR